MEEDCYIPKIKDVVWTNNKDQTNFVHGYTKRKKYFKHIHSFVI